MGNFKEQRQQGLAKLAEMLAADGQRAPGAEVIEAVEAFGQQVGLMAVRLMREGLPGGQAVLSVGCAAFDLVCLWRDLDGIWDRELGRLTGQEEDRNG